MPSQQPQEPQAQVEARTRVDSPAAHTLRRWGHWLPAAFFFLILFLGLTAILTVRLPAGPVQYQAGDVAKINIRAPKRVSYVSQLETRAAKEEAAARIPDIYDYDPGLAQQQRAQAQVLLNGVTNIRADVTATADQERERIQRLSEGIVSSATGRAIAALDDLSWSGIVTETSRVLDEVMRDRVRQTELASIKVSMPSRFSQALSSGQQTVATLIVNDLIKPNEVLNVSETTRQRREAQDQIEPVREVVEKGEIVVREGNVVSASDLEKLEALGLQQAETEWSEIIAAVLIVLIWVTIFFTYLRHYQAGILHGDRRAVLLVGMILLVAGATRLAATQQISESMTWAYLVPYATVGMLVAILIDQQLALLVTALLGILAGFMTGNSLDVAVLAAVGGAVGSLSMRRVERLSAFLWAGVIVATANVLVVLAFYLPSPDFDVQTLGIILAMVIAGGGLAAAITAMIFAPLGNILGVTTVLHYLELAHPSQPLFQRLLLEASGTYHHSAVLSNLTERAAQAIGADAMLLRVASYYHDIGKVLHPYFFIENQANGFNIHTTMEPQTSAQVIIAHVSDGVALARKYHLPGAIRDMIQQHHGTKLTGYFYSQACAAHNSRVDDTAFRYPGPKPQSREAGVLMLADAVEAAVRSSPDRSQEAIERIVADMINSHVDDGQLNECDLSLRDLEAIRAAFCGVLQGVYHPRIAYPALPAPANALPAATETSRLLPEGTAAADDAVGSAPA